MLEEQVSLKVGAFSKMGCIVLLLGGTLEYYVLHVTMLLQRPQDLMNGWLQCRTSSLI
jgi:hypothetical protein